MVIRGEGRQTFGVGPVVNSLWWPSCGASIGWAWGPGLECNPVSLNGYGFEKYVELQTYETPVYVYGENRDLVWLFLKDGTMREVSDYWLVNGQIHFAAIEGDPLKPREHTFPY